MNSTDVWLIVVVVVLVVLAAVLAVAETAITRTTKSRAAALVEQERRGADRLQRIVGNLERDLNAVYLAVNITQVVQAALVGVVAARIFGPLGLTIGVILNVAVLFTVAEAAPKTWALQHTDRAALMTAPLVDGVGWVLRLPARGLIGVANILLPGKGLKRGPFVTEEELLALAEEAAEAAVIEESERDLISSIIDFGDTVAREVMVPRPDVVAVDQEATVSDAVALAIARGFTRLPVYGESADDVVGVVHLKDAVAVERSGGGDRPVTEVAHDAYFIPETKPVADLLTEMRARSVHIAVVVDEYGGTAGLVTLEDVIEELVGEIRDEFDTEVGEVETLPGGDLLVNATLNVDDLNERAGLDLPEGSWDSVGGLVFATLGRVPVPGDAVEVGALRMVVERVDGRRVALVRVQHLEDAADVATVPDGNGSAS